MRPTRTGLIVGVASAALVLLGRLLGLTELYAIGAAIGLLAVVCGLWVALRRLDIAVTRSVRPSRVHAGNPCTVEIQLRNRSGRATPVLRLLDPVTGTAGADLMLAPIGLRKTTSVAYRLPTTKRGIVAVGPMQVAMSDPFGLTSTRSPAAPPVEVTVLPRVDEIPPLPRSVGPDPDGSAETGSLGRSGEDFAALRPYIVGDDLRRVHWPSSARTGDLLVRQHDVPWQGRVCVVLDLRRQSADDVTFERVVSAAASVLRAHIRRGDHVRLVTTTGVDSGYGLGASHLDGLLEHLAVVARTTAGSLRMAMELVERGASGAVVLVTGTISGGDVELFERSGRAVSLRRLVRFDGAQRLTTARRSEVLGVGPAEEFATAWSESTGATVGRRRRRQVVS